MASKSSSIIFKCKPTRTWDRVGFFCFFGDVGARSLSLASVNRYDGAMNQGSVTSRTHPLTVSQLTQRIRGVIESVPRIWLVGEISNFKAAGSGHWYFSLKDNQSQIRANMWRSAAQRVSFRPRDGMEVLVSGQLSVYPPRGEYSIVVDRIEQVGVGRLRAEFERLKAKLKQEGLFDEANKQALPLLPRKIGIVTSPTGAAIRDMLRVLQARLEGLHVLIYPARVQGQGAAEEIAAGIECLDRWGACDVLIIGRGGGSEEDLWSFNEEVVARAIHAAATPIVSAVGHEVDFTIADFVADVRAATPSNAAELVVRSHTEYKKTLDILRQTMARSMQQRLLYYKNRINVSESHPIFVRVRSRLNVAQRSVAELDYELRRRLTQLLRDRERRLQRATERVRPDVLRGRVALLAQRLAAADREMPRRVKDRLEQGTNRLEHWVSRLDDLSPLKVLGRGYALVRDERRRVVARPEDVRIGSVVNIRLRDGEMTARVIERPVEAVQESLFES
ncbi:exodeoxyribonuclease VII large subunit [Sulfidibacter corallicola]